MRVYWYWPFLREEDSIIVAATAKTGLEIHVDTLDRCGAPAAHRSDDYSVSPILREVGEFSRRSPLWLLDRVRTYSSRNRTRSRRIAELEPDIVHVWFVNRFVDAFTIPRLAKQRTLILHIHDVLPHGRRLPAIVERWLLRRIYRADVHIVVHHQHLAIRLNDLFGVRQTRVHEIPLMVRPTLSHAAENTRSDRTILVFGTLRPNKGLGPLLSALADTRDTDFRLVVAGRGDRSIERLVRETAARDPRVEAHIGWIAESEKAALFANAAVIAMPYTSFESQSGVLHDAYAHGVPVAVTDVGALGISVREDDTGVVVDPSDAAGVLAAALRLLDNPDERERLSLNSARLAHDRSPESIGRQLRALYDVVD